MVTERKNDVDTFYNLLKEVLTKFPKRTLNEMSGNNMPEKGVYFFFEKGENRAGEHAERVVRIGTHAAIANSNATLYKRLYNHKGSKNLTGNHRASVFRKLIGHSIIKRDSLNFLNVREFTSM
jgi:hypothetical protein